MSYRIVINGTERVIDADGDTPLLWALREQLGLTGTKFGCGAALCGACTVHMDGQAVRSCSLPLSAVTGPVQTIEAMQDDAVGQVVQQKWLEEDVVQCGYCQPGQIMSACALLKHNKRPTTVQIQEAMSGNLCRCGTYARIEKAIVSASQAL